MNDMNDDEVFDYERNETEEDVYQLPGSEYQWHDEYPVREKPEKRGRKRTGAGIIAAALCFSTLGGILGAGGALWAVGYLDKEEPLAAGTGADTVMLEGIREKSQIEIVQLNTGEELTAAQVYAANVNSTVGITTSVTTNLWGFQTTSAASGSGFIISTDGYILTNYHVIQGADSITVSMYDGSSYAGELIGYDANNDIAVVKVDAGDLAPVILGDSDALNVGDPVVAIGNPLGELTFSLTSGSVSAKDREITLSSSVTMDLIQTDCAINSGNSGGALFNMYGEVVGVTNAKYSSSSSSEASIDNIGFAIPINDIRTIVESIIEKGYISSPYIGISVMDVSAETQMYGIPAGIAVQSVTEGAPAAQAGLQQGDVIVSVDGAAMDSSALVEYVGAAEIGQVLEMEVYRQGVTITLRVTVGEQIRSALSVDDSESSAQDSQGRFPQQGGSPFGGRY